MWKFRKLEKGSPIIDPHEFEFFKSIDLPAAVTREAIQNSLDAKLTNNFKAKVSIEFLKLDYSTVRKFFKGL
ncbi:MAG TPA: hypothetical protein PLW02_13440, partial [Verrucomicrobiota bacterium]|nr:hypothetical protein [Verrucomicrobiota bacterium]